MVNTILLLPTNMSFAGDLSFWSVCTYAFVATIIFFITFIVMNYVYKKYKIPEDYNDDKPLFIGFMIMFAVAWWILLPFVIFGAIGFIIYKKISSK